MSEQIPALRMRKAKKAIILTQTEGVEYFLQFSSRKLNYKYNDLDTDKQITVFE